MTRRMNRPGRASRGQIGLFDTMKTSSELSISDMEKAMQSQTDYLNLYSENLKRPQNTASMTA